MPPGTQREDWWGRFQLTGTNDNKAKTARFWGARTKGGLVRKYLYDLVFKPRVLETTRETTTTLPNLPQVNSSAPQLPSRPTMDEILRTPLAWVDKVDQSIRPKMKHPEFRILILEGLPKAVNVPALVSEICCGPLEKFIFHDSDRPELEVFFQSPEQAQHFFEYVATSGFFCIYGKSVKVRWAEKAEQVPVPAYIMDEVSSNRASRIIIMSKSIRTKTSKILGRKSRLAEENFSGDFNVEGMKWDFVQFGGIVEITPMISRKLSICIQFTDIRSAILVLHSLKQKNSMLHSKYALWSARYGSDPADRPCKRV